MPGKKGKHIRNNERGRKNRKDLRKRIVNEGISVLTRTTKSWN